MTVDEAKQEIKSANKMRAILYHYLLDETEQAVGAEKAAEIFRKATHRRGRDIQKMYGDCLTGCDFREVARKFVAISAAEGTLFTPAVESADDDRAVVTMKTCPLVEAWKEMGLSGDRIARLCDVASAIDHGTFESEATTLAFSHKLGQGDEMCRLIISKRA